MSGDVFYVSRVRGAFDLEPPISLGLITDQHPPIQVARLIQMARSIQAGRLIQMEQHMDRSDPPNILAKLEGIPMGHHSLELFPIKRLSQP